MTFRFDPRGDLPPLMIQHLTQTSYGANGRFSGSNIWSQERNTEGKGYHRHHQTSRPKKRPCYDWIFSSGSNVHVGIDRSVFKTYTSFKSYVLAVADQRQIPVRGVGTIELKIRCQPGSKESQVITLENVLHIPGWLCNVFSDIYFTPASEYEHTWTDFGVSFLRRDNGMLRYWGFTENFCSLDKLVLAKDLRGRSPMLEDKDREVFSVNVTWPQGQRDNWDAQVRAEEEKNQKREMQREQKSGLTDMSSLSKSLRSGSAELRREHRSGLTDISRNLMNRGLSIRSSSLKAPTSSHGSFREIFH